MIIYNDLSLKYKSSNYFDLSPKNLANTTWYSGSIDNNGDDTLSTIRLVSDYIELSRVNLCLNFSIDGAKYLINEYDANKTAVYLRTTYVGGTRQILMSPDTKFIRICLVDKENTSKTLYPEDVYSYKFSVYEIPITTKLKVMTYNVGHYAYGTGMGLPASTYDEKFLNWKRFIGKIGVDIIGIQEFDSWMNDAETEENAIIANDVFWDNFYKYGKETGTKTAIKSKEYFSWCYNRQLTSGTYYTIAWINGICLMSVHLSVGAANTQTRLTEAAEIVSLLENEDRFIIFGDFNCEPGEEDALYGVFTSQNYKIANCGFFGDYYTWSSARTDFSHYDNPTGELYYIDNIIVSDNINIVDAYAVPEAYDICTSDHIPFVAELEIS